jgi:catechol 2,3-dioxygenase-like lactoylglutathione lyase family enzyme
MIDHMTLTVRDLARSKSFYARVLAPLGYRILMEFDGACGFGDTKPYFWMREGNAPTTPQHIAFAARRRADVDAFYGASLAAGARDNGRPGLRPDYHPSYYAAFVFDPDDHPIEAVNHREVRPSRRKARTRAASRRGKRESHAPSKVKGGARKRTPRR